MSFRPAASPRSLVGALRVGGGILILAFLSIVAVALALERGWVSPSEDAARDAQKLVAASERLRDAIGDERRAREIADGARTSVLVDAAASVDRARADLASAAHAAPFDDAVASFDRVEQLLATERSGAGFEPRRVTDELALLASRARLEATRLATRTERLLKARTIVLVLMSLAGGLAAWAATLVAIGRTRASLRSIGNRVAAIEAGELAPRHLDAFVEIAEVNERLNRLGEALARSREETRLERDRASARRAELEIAHELVLEVSRARNESEAVAA
ncbi:MAG TPA: hypothetical protein VKE69_05455, partial [Planctomycetota bacterium]|nr:hypothetical protein [Planctomycetota bacterium]